MALGATPRHTYVVVPGRNHTGNVGAVVLKAIIYVFVAAEVEVEASVDVVLQVLMSVVHSVIDHCDIDALSLNAFGPDGTDVGILPFRMAEVPLA